MARGTKGKKWKWGRKLNPCAGFLTQKIFDADGELPIHTIEKNESKLRFRKPFVKASKFNSKIPEFHPTFEVIGDFAQPRIISANKLTYVSILKDGQVIERKLVSKNKLNLNNSSYEVKQVPHNTKIIIDKNNKRIKLIGKKAFSEWIDLDVIPPHPSTGNKNAFNYLIKQRLKQELHSQSQKSYI
jgi:hypothetical protein